jgi:hypothetical protein
MVSDMKTEFELQYFPEGKAGLANSGHKIKIIGMAIKNAEDKTTN